MSDKCGAKNRNGEPCGHPAGWGTDHNGEGRCKFHGGTNPGAPENNGNAVKHNMYSARGKLYERLSDEHKEFADALHDALVGRYEEFHGREPDLADKVDLFHLSMGPVKVMMGENYMSKKGELSGNPMVEHVEYENDFGTVEYDKPTQLIDLITDVRREDRLLKKHMGLFRDADMKNAEAQGDLVDAWKQGLRDAEESATDGNS